MGMLIDEIITKETEIAQEFQEVIDTHMISEDMSLEEAYCGNTELIESVLKRHKEWVDYHNTIANIMRKYQKIVGIYQKWNRNYDLATSDAWVELMEVLEDGNDN